MTRSFLVAPHRSSRVLALLTLLLLLATGGGLASATHVRAQELKKVTVALDWYPNANHAGLFLAKERGYFAAEGLDVELYTPADPTVVLQTVGSGKDTLGISYQTDLLLARAQAVPVVSVAALVQQPLLGVMSLTSAGITRPHDLVGKTVGYPGIPSQEAFLATMLEADGATREDVKLVDVGFSLVPAVVSGRVDAVMGAYWTHETIVAAREGHPVDLLRVEQWGVPSYYELVLVAGEQTLGTDPETVRAFVRAMQHGYADAIADPAAAVDALAAASPDLDRAVETEGLALLTPAWTAGDVPVGTQDPARWRAYAAWMMDQGLIPKDVNVGASFTTAVLPTPAATPAAAATPEP